MTLSMCLLVDFSCIGKSDPSHFRYLKKKKANGLHPFCWHFFLVNLLYATHFFLKVKRVVFINFKIRCK